MSANFLDSYIKKQNSRYHTKYNFGFDIIRMPYKSNNISH